jgi:DDE superfamily endonuclease/Tc5 transposase DNA-binding domain/helix-turn-helix, Psq domain
MTRARNPLATEKEAQYQEAITAIRKGRHTCHSAAIAFGLPRSTLYDRVNGGKQPRNVSHESQQILSHAEERELVRWITRLTISGYPPRHSTLKEMAEEVRKRRVKQINDDDIQLVHYDDIGAEWVSRFLRRHPELASVTLRSIESNRLKAATPERLQQYFDELEKVVAEYKILPKDKYNMDESGYAIGEIEASKCIINANIRQQFQSKPGRQEWVTSVECICADGTALPPLIIFKGTKLSTRWVDGNIPEDWKFACNTKGWTSNEHGIKWLRECFEPLTREKAAGKYRLLICDGHDSHITGEFIGHCMDNDILLFILPPHSSHLTQPLDVGVFRPLKKYMAKALQPLISTGIARLQKVEWLTAFVTAHNQAFSALNIFGGFRGTGIHPFEPEKVLNRIPSSAPTTVNRASPPHISTTPFNEAVLTNSPANFNAVQYANAALVELAQSKQPLSSPAKNYVGYLTQCYERSHSENRILHCENERLKASMGRRGRVLSSKRRAIDGKHLMTTPDILGSVREAEKETQIRVQKRGQKSKKRGPKGKREVIEESSEESDATDEELAEMFDCIRVEM